MVNYTIRLVSDIFPEFNFIYIALIININDSRAVTSYGFLLNFLSGKAFIGIGYSFSFTIGCAEFIFAFLVGVVIIIGIFEPMQMV